MVQSRINLTAKQSSSAFYKKEAQSPEPSPSARESPPQSLHQLPHTAPEHKPSQYSSSEKVQVTRSSPHQSVSHPVPAPDNHPAQSRVQSSPAQSACASALPQPVSPAKFHAPQTKAYPASHTALGLPPTH